MTKRIKMGKAVSSSGFLSLRLAGRLPLADRWYPPRNLGAYAGAIYDLTRVNWQLGDTLGFFADRGPIRVDPNLLDGAGIPDAYWIILPVDGLILYETENNLIRAGIIGVAAIAAHLLNRYDRARLRYGLPPRRIAYTTEPEPSYWEFSEDGEIIGLLNGGVCAPEITDSIFDFSLPEDPVIPELPSDISDFISPVGEELPGLPELPTIPIVPG
jgi:hypothetical protein